jgi:hypothetical protein
MANDRKHDRDHRDDRALDDETARARDEGDAERPVEPNPPRTTTGVWTSPKFGSAGSGGAELEPGPERD